ncbi:DEAD/DEAH box helicase [Metabacillus arenae]|uniref:DEAD-box ATP-dependent RNA helicase CshB n=1 Tax=Metabacillus arenae TaxID=2771434 RepID=A0A926RYI9_9BACI|nr:DEAD/DEAH box helicase [Metabacillus arenae]MBD1382126.1 DEAD/DEAH box helicase [Metabacillus arenae]
MEASKFKVFNLKPFIIEAITDRGFYEPTEVQTRIIPSALKGESVIGQSQTGTGKTHAYLIPLLNQINPKKDKVQAIIAAPTRELADQIYQEIGKMTMFSPDGEEIRTKKMVGGTDKQKTIDKLKIQPHLVVGTPGRINDLIKENALLVHNASTLVIDEADMILDMGFIEDVDRIASSMAEEIQMLVFSATIPEKLKPFLKKYMENPKYTHVAPKQATAVNISHVLIPSRHRDKGKVLYDMLKAYNPYLAIVFTNTKKQAEYVAQGLAEKGLKVGRIHGDLSPRERKKMMKQINDLDFQFVVATDLAARGIDIEGVSHVINYELPSDLEFYIHRVGRTARAGYSGIATTIYELADEDALNKLEKMGITFQYKDLIDGEWKELDDRHKRRKRKKSANETDKMAKSLVRKPKTVKPGYKKKMTQEMDQIKKRQRRLNRRGK